MHPEKNLITLLSVIAGMVDLIGYLKLGNIFAAHVTGNFVLISAGFVRGGPVNIAQLLTIPMFILAVSSTWLIARLSNVYGVTLARALLATQFALLAGVVIFAGALKPSSNPHGLSTGIAAMMAVGGMGCQFTLLRLCFPHASSTVVMTSNLTNALLTFLEAYVRPQATRDDILSVEHHLRPVFGFLIGCVLAAFAVIFMSDFAWAVPAVLAGIAIPLCPNRLSSSGSQDFQS